MEGMVTNNKAMDEATGEMEGMDITRVVEMDGKIETDIIELTKINGGRHNTHLVTGRDNMGANEGEQCPPHFLEKIRRLEELVNYMEQTERWSWRNAKGRGGRMI